MRILILFFLGLISSSSIFSQAWFNSDHSWVFHFGVWSIQGYSEVHVSHDTTLNGQNAKVLKRSATYVDFALQRQDTFHRELDDLIMREEGEKVYYWDIDSFALCYDFGMGIYDYHIFKRPDCGMDMWWVVMDTGSVLINSVKRKTQTIQVTENLRGDMHHIRVIQGIGITQIKFKDHEYWSYGYLVPQITYPCYVDGIGYGFSCFSDNGQTYKLDSMDCYFLPKVRTSSEDISESFALEIYPNPSHGKYHIDLEDRGQMAEIRVSNSTGELVYFSTNNDRNFDLEDEPKGVYYVQVLINEKYRTKRIIKQ